MPTDTKQPERRDIFCRRLSLRAESVNEEERSFEAVVSTETPAMVYDYAQNRVVEEVLVARGGEFPDSVPLLDDHNRWGGSESVMGSAASFRMEAGRWVGRGVVAEPADDTDPVRRIWSRLRGGHLRAVSIGYRVLEFVDIPPGQRQKINGRTWEAGKHTLRITTKWRAHELSLTPIGADSAALIRNETGAKPRTLKRRFFR